MWNVFNLFYISNMNRPQYYVLALLCLLLTNGCFTPDRNNTAYVLPKQNYVLVDFRGGFLPEQLREVEHLQICNSISDLNQLTHNSHYHSTEYNFVLVCKGQGAFDRSVFFNREGKMCCKCKKSYSNHSDASKLEMVIINVISRMKKVPLKY